jgi:hypothetical protein
MSLKHICKACEVIYDSGAIQALLFEIYFDENGAYFQPGG